MVMMISWVAPVNPSHPYLENDPAPSFDPHHLRISPWLWFRFFMLGECNTSPVFSHKEPSAAIGLMFELVIVKLTVAQYQDGP